MTKEPQQPVLVILAAGLARRFGGACKPLAPLGLQGEAVIDLTAGDAWRAGFGEVVVMLNPQTAPAVRYHIRRTWPKAISVSFALQALPLGTAHAVLCAKSSVGDRPFAVVNGDDVYGVEPLLALRRHLRLGAEHALVAFRLDDSVAGDDAVTRGTCQVTDDGLLAALAERKLVSRQPDGWFRSADGRQPERLSPDTLVSVNCWGLLPSVWPVLEEAVENVHPRIEARPVGPGSRCAGAGHQARPGATEVLLPEVVSDMVAGKGGQPRQPVRVLPGEGRCVGVTHVDDLPVVRSELAIMVGDGARPADPWDGVG